MRCWRLLYAPNLGAAKEDTEWVYLTGEGMLADEDMQLSFAVSALSILNHLRMESQSSPFSLHACPFMYSAVNPAVGSGAA